ncbi:MAG TPA: RHS repeat-associated core domain-containing protein [Bacteroidales bacterium]|nr:RHS repeat-associated core domain-containing protein [Bacteroidales bacterium]HPS16562.1 RHS repeat-associated core domain-containing protein [Bacteroidales bacterium]
MLANFQQFELSNHLGSVLTTVSDHKIANDNNSDGIIDYYTADITSAVDLYPFGSEMPGRSFNPTASKYGFNGKLKDNEITGVDGASYDFGARIYDSRIGRFLKTDDKKHVLVHLSPYHYALNSPIRVIDEDGEFPILINGNTFDGDYQRASPKYWSSSTLNTIASTTGYKMGSYFDGTSASKSRFSSDFFFVDGNKGLWPNTRRNAGLTQAKVDAQAVWNKMKETMKDGKITEQLQVITHSRGSAYGEGYMEGMRTEILKLANKEGIGFAYNNNSIIEYSVNIAPHQSNWINYPNSGTKNINISHIGDLLSGDDATGDVINVTSIPEEEMGPIEQHTDASYNKELNFILKILESGTSKGLLFNAIKEGYKNYDTERTNGDESTVTKGN